LFSVSEFLPVTGGMSEEGRENRKQNSELGVAEGEALLFGGKKGRSLSPQAGATGESLK
jgi:hypothetical protein